MELNDTGEWNEVSILDIQVLRQPLPIQISRISDRVYLEPVIVHCGMMALVTVYLQCSITLRIFASNDITYFPLFVITAGAVVQR